MSTAERPQMRSVYPAHWIDDVIGRNTSTLNEAIECWATQVSVATISLVGLFYATDWEVLPALFQGDELSPRDSQPGKALARMFQEWAGHASVPPVQARRLLTGLHSLSYDQAWALMIGVRWHHKNPDVKSWWSLAARQEGATR